MRRLSRALAAAALLAGTAGIAHAHTTTPGWRLRVDGVNPKIADLTIEAHNLVGPVMRVRNDTGETFEVIGSDGVAFLRLKDGDVEANISSPDWYRSESPAANGWVAPTAKPGGKPRWARIASGDEWAWFEHRVGSPIQQATWAIPVRLGGRALTVRGRWEPAALTGVFQTVLDGTHPTLPDGVEFKILQGPQPAIYVANPTGLVLEIPGRRGEPFLRIGPNGAEQADASGTWSRLGSAPRWAWVEPRAGWPSEDPPPAALISRTAIDLGDWSIPVTFGGTPFELFGRVRWEPLATHHPPPSTSRTPSPWRWILAAALAPALFLIAAAAARKRRERPV